MPKSFTPLTAGTSFPNTPESDKQAFVWNDVEVRVADGSTVVVRVRAAAPDVALDKVKAMNEEEFAALTRVTTHG